jgi:hypothetical protein
MRSYATILVCVLLMAACAKTTPESDAVADQFMRAYFVNDSVADAAKLASGAAKTALDGVLQQIQAAGVKEPGQDKPKVTITLETRFESASEIAYVYRVDSQMAGIQPITASLRLRKVGETWSVMEFSQSQ